jgi:hypothetical protein
MQWQLDLQVTDLASETLRKDLDAQLAEHVTPPAGEAPMPQGDLDMLEALVEQAVELAHMHTLSGRGKIVLHRSESGQGSVQLLAADLAIAQNHDPAKVAVRVDARTAAAAAAARAAARKKVEVLTRATIGKLVGGPKPAPARAGAPRPPATPPGRRTP